MAPRTIETAATTVTFDRGLLTIRSKGVRSTPESVEQTFVAARDVMGSNRHPILFDARDWPGGDYEAWIRVIVTLEEVFSAVAVLATDADDSRFDPFAKAIDRLLIPFSVFGDEDEAKAFLAPYSSPG